MKTNIKLFNFLGSSVNLDIFFLFIFLIFPITISLSIFISVLIHEMAHAFIANKKGYHVYGININLFGGSAAVDSNIHEKDSIPITAAGPISNLLLYVISFIISLFVNNQFITDFIYVNLFLLIFNILPIYPMDGGRIVRDFLVWKSRKMNITRKKAIEISAKISMIFSILLFLFSLINGYLIMAILGLVFTYQSFKTLKS
jgi:Zn-dependent protease